MGNGERLTIELSGGAPWGFRLFGGDEEPLIVAKLRKRSKASEAGLTEDDVILAINGKICRGMNHPDAMALVDTAKQTLILQVLRGSNVNENDINAAYDAVVQHLIRPPPAKPAGLPYIAEKKATPTVIPAHAPPSQVKSTVTKEVFSVGNATGDVTTTQTTQQFGSTKVTKVRRETNIHNTQPAVLTSQQQKPAQFTPIPVNKSAPKPAVWSPGSTEQSQQHVTVLKSPTGQLQQQIQQFPVTNQQQAKWAPKKCVVQPPEQSVWSPQQQQKPQHQSVAQPSFPPPRPIQQQQKQQPPQHQQHQQRLPAPPNRLQLKPGTWAPPSQRPPERDEPSPVDLSPQIHDIESEHQKFDHVPIWGPKAVFGVNGTQEPVSPKPKPGTWTPGKERSEVLSAQPTNNNNISVQQNEDSSITMTIGFPAADQADDVDKENVRPLAKIPKYKIPGDAQGKHGIWQPSTKPAPPPPRYADPDVAKPKPLPELVYKIEHKGPTTVEDKNKLPPLTPELSRILHMDGAESDASTPDSISTGGGSKSNLRKAGQERVYSDSAFYADQGNTFPTVEEQMKMAKRVAISLMAPANQKARGHQMFMKRKRKSQKWTTAESTGLSGEKSSSGGDLANIADFDEFDDPNQPLFTFRIPKLATRKPDLKPVEKRVLSKQDIEEVRLHEKRNMHNTVAPQVCFSIAEALHSTKGKGGKIFAKRRAKSESWVIDESNVKSPPVTPAPLSAGVPTSSRLKELTEAAKARVTPWEAALGDPTGDVDAAFEHLRRSKAEDEVFSSLQEAALQKQSQQLQGPPSWMKKPGQPIPVTHYPAASLKGANQNNARYRDFNNKIKGWGSADVSVGGYQSPQLDLKTFEFPQVSHDSPTSPLGMFESFNVAPRGWGRGPPSAQCDRPPSPVFSDSEYNFRKVEFQKSTSVGVFDAKSAKASIVRPYGTFLSSSESLYSLNKDTSPGHYDTVSTQVIQPNEPITKTKISEDTTKQTDVSQNIELKLTVEDKITSTMETRGDVGKELVKENVALDRSDIHDATKAETSTESGAVGLSDVVCEAEKGTLVQTAASVQEKAAVDQIDQVEVAADQTGETDAIPHQTDKADTAASNTELPGATDSPAIQPKQPNITTDVTEAVNVDLVKDIALEQQKSAETVSYVQATAEPAKQGDQAAADVVATSVSLEESSHEFTFTLANDVTTAETPAEEFTAELVAGFETGTEAEVEDIFSDL